MPLFGHEYYQVKVREFNEDLAKIKANEENWNAMYDLELLLADFKEELKYWHFSSRYYSFGTINIVLNKGSDINKVMDFIFEEVDELLEASGFKLNTDSARQRRYEYRFEWRKGKFGLEMKVDTNSICKRVRTGQMLVDTYEYICGGN